MRIINIDDLKKLKDKYKFKKKIKEKTGLMTVKLTK